MKVQLALQAANRSWIIQKFAEKLQEHLEAFDIRARFVESPGPDADIVHHMSWAFANVATPQPSTMFITHLDDIYKMNEVRATLANHVDVGICMSIDTMEQLQRHGVPASALHAINPAHDASTVPRRIVIGITSRVYPDGRKREALLHGLAKRMDLGRFEFRIFGIGWEPTATRLERAGARVILAGESDDYRRDYEAIQQAVPHFDYYLYLGMDEGSLGTLDALNAGVPTIVTPQGFHLDLPGGITHPVLTLEDLERVFRDIAGQRDQRMAAVQDLTWRSYARRHAQLWQALLKGEALAQERPAAPSFDAALLASCESLQRRSLWANALQPRRILSALSHMPVLAAMRRQIDRKRFKR